MPINLSLLSPSSIGDYAACSQRLVFDSQYGKPFGSSPHADFGTVCHYWTQYILGTDPKDEPSDQTIASARTLPEFTGKSEEKFTNAVAACAKKAKDSLPGLPQGITWVAEAKTYDRSLLPTRIGRKGEVSGFGGNIDLLRSDRTELWDLKFVGRPPDKVRMAYVWQLGSYHILSKVPITGILFTTRDARWSGTLKIDWRTPLMASMARNIDGFIRACELVNFEKHAYPVAGDHCYFCEHKHRCPAQQLPALSTRLSIDLPPVGDPNWLASLQAQAKGNVL